MLLIVAALPPERLRELHALAEDAGHGRAGRSRTTGPSWRPRWQLQARAWWGSTTATCTPSPSSLETTLRLRPRVPPGSAVVAESGIHTRADVERLAQAGVDAILVGEALVTAADTAAKVRELAG